MSLKRFCPILTGVTQIVLVGHAAPKFLVWGRVVSVPKKV